MRGDIKLENSLVTKVIMGTHFSTSGDIGQIYLGMLPL